MEPIRVPLAVVNLTRDSTRAKGAWAKNVFLEQEGGEVHLVKRPGLSVSAAGASTGQGVFNYNNLGYAVNGDALIRQTYYQSVTCNPNIPSGLVQAGSSIYGGDATNFLTSTDGLNYTAVRASVIAPFLYRATVTGYGGPWQFGFDATNVSFTSLLYRSNDNWATNTTTDLTAAGVVFNNGISLLADSGGLAMYLFAWDAGASKTWRWTSTDNGATWGSKTAATALWTYSGIPGLPIVNSYNCVYFAPAAAYFMIPFFKATDADCYLLKSTDGFLTATDVTPVFPGKTVRGMGIVNNLLCIAVYDPATHSYKIYQSSNGSSWYTSANTYQMTLASGYSPVFERIFAAASNRIVFYFVNAGH